MSVWHYELDPESFSELRSEFSAALCAQDPEFWAARYSLGRVYLELGQLEEAEDHLAQALELDPQSITTLRALQSLLQKRALR